jgi:hypothetical protein
LWTASIYRPGRLDDEEVPEGADGLTPWWYADTSGGFGWDRKHRPDWPTLLYAQVACSPTPNDWCAHDGRCNGACEKHAG